MRVRNWASEESKKGTYHYCKQCSKRVMKAELMIVDGIVYHNSCYWTNEGKERDRRDKLARADNTVYYEMLRKHKGLK